MVRGDGKPYCFTAALLTLLITTIHRVHRPNQLDSSDLPLAMIEFTTGEPTLAVSWRLSGPGPRLSNSEAPARLPACSRRTVRREL
jgi:hypothetical protein